jgi:hypothetical protein
MDPALLELTERLEKLEHWDPDTQRSGSHRRRLGPYWAPPEGGFQSVRRDLNSGPLVPQTSPATCRGEVRVSATWLSYCVYGLLASCSWLSPTP